MKFICLKCIVIFFPFYHIESIKTVLYVRSTIIRNLTSNGKAAAYTKVDKIMKKYIDKINNFPKNIHLLYRQIYLRLLSCRFSNAKLNICFESH